jgi:hypothetical protein
MAAGAALVLVRIFAGRAPLESVNRTYPALGTTTSPAREFRGLCQCGVRATLISPRVTRERASAWVAMATTSATRFDLSSRNDG